MDHEIKERIAKLLAKAEATNNPHERDAFMAKVNAMLEEYQLEIWQVRNAGKDPMAHIDGEAAIFMSMPWGREVVWAVARYFYCEAVFTGQVVKSRKLYKLVGRQSCCVTTELMLPFIISQIRQRARDMVAEYAERGVELTKTKAERLVGNALISRVYKMIRDREETVSDTTETEINNDFTGKALVLVDETEAYMSELYPKLKIVKNRKRETTKLAVELASKVSLNHQATGTRTKLLA